MGKELDPKVAGLVVVILLLGLILYLARATGTQYTKKAPPGIPAEVQREFQRRAASSQGRH
jgi:hypothetical protein